MTNNLIQGYNQKKFAKIIKRIDSNILLIEEGRKCLKSNESLGLIVPSILIPEEKNILINPNHKMADKIKIIKIDQKGESKVVKVLGTLGNVRLQFQTEMFIRLSSGGKRDFNESKSEKVVNRFQLLKEVLAPETIMDKVLDKLVSD